MKILYEDKDLIVVVKPANIATESANVRQKDMIDEIRNHLLKEDTNIKSKKEAPYIGLIHRLDQPVEGILVFAKNKQAASKLSMQLQDRSMDKYYIAIVEGIVDPKENTVSIASDDNGLTDEAHRLVNFIYKDKKENKAIITDSAKSDLKGQVQRAELSYKLISYDNEKKRSRLEIHLVTGRFHQIRCQLSAIGHPIINDSKYNYSGQKDSSYKGIALCAYKLSFIHPITNKKMTFEIPFNQ